METNQISSNQSISAIATARLRTSLSVYYLNASKIFIEKAREYENGETLSKEQKYAYWGYCVHSLISSVMGLEAYVNENLCKITGSGIRLPQCNQPNHRGNPAIENKICELVNQEGSKVEFQLNDCVKHIIFLRNEFIHYDYEAIPGDVFVAPTGDAETRLNASLVFLTL